MTADGLCASLAWSAVAGYAAWRADAIALRYLATRELAERNRTERVRERLASAERLAVSEADRERLAKLANRPLASIDLPDDLEAVALQESEPWAQDNERTLIRERFRDLFDGDDRETWQKVRRAVGVAEMP